MPLGRCNRARQDSRTGFEPDFRLKKHAVLTQKRPILTPFQRENRKIQGVGQKRKVQQTLEFTGLFWRRVRDSNPRSLSAYSISSAAPSTTRTTLQGLSQHQNYLGKRGELMGRTSKNIKLRIPEKPHKIKGFRSGSYRVATTISSVAPSTSRTTLRIPQV